MSTFILQQIVSSITWVTRVKTKTEGINATWWQTVESKISTEQDDESELQTGQQLQFDDGET